MIPWLMQHTGARSFYLPSADYIWPRLLNERARSVVAANGGTIVGALALAILGHELVEHHGELRRTELDGDLGGFSFFHDQ